MGSLIHQACGIRTPPSCCAPRGTFVVNSLQQNAKVPSVEVHSPAGGTCRLAHPWNDGEAALCRNGKRAKDLLRNRR